MQKSNEISEINKALAEFRKEVKQPLKDANNPFFKSKYVPLENVVEAIDDVAPKHGLSFTQWPVSDGNGNVGVSTMLLHSSGQYIEYDPVYMKPDKQTPQAIGSAITYSKRYSLSAVFGITSDEDDDGNQATGNGNNNQRKQHNQLPVQDKGKVTLVQQNANDLAEIINAQDGADQSNPMTQQKIIDTYVKKIGITNIGQATNEQLITITQYIKKNIEKYQEGSQGK